MRAIIHLKRRSKGRGAPKKWRWWAQVYKGDSRCGTITCLRSRRVKRDSLKDVKYTMSAFSLPYENL